MEDPVFDKSGPHVVVTMHQCVDSAYRGTAQVYTWDRDAGEKTVLYQSDLEIGAWDCQYIPAVDRAVAATVTALFLALATRLGTNPSS
jgi:hypothetical protein